MKSYKGPDSLIMRVVTSDSGSVSVGNQYTDDLENPDTSDDAEFWRKESSVPRFVAAPSISRWRWRVYIAVGVTALMMLLLIITVSVSHVKFDRKFSTTETNMKNLTETLLSIITRAKILEEFGQKMHSDITNLEFDQETMQTRMYDMSDSAQVLRDKVSELKCRIDKYINNNTQELCCPEGWLLFSTHCYFFSKDGMPWDAARDECENKRAALLIINSKQEKSFVVSKTMPLFYWLGLTDGRTGEWEWLDETPYVFVRSEWMPGQPDNWQKHGLGGGEDCAHFHHDGRYNDDHCSRRYRYVCKAHASSI
ncbi:asialoglycoprotein receptor 1 isoform X2 [Ctenopharyngodon idella]|uniref:asialoglycoprotein receptor 1 isoform X2 n=1 Tax=Ctenopharyngodon idella TaxID=7959 RepID=UPI002230AC4E|nr:asialoglycoprotein receptor 1 isoform X2 [Ctenopharyngodon idella]